MRGTVSEKKFSLREDKGGSPPEREGRKGNRGHHEAGCLTVGGGSSIENYADRRGGGHQGSILLSGSFGQKKKEGWQSE